MDWFLFAIIALLAYGTSNLLLKIGAERKLNYWILTIMLYFAAGIITFAYIFLVVPTAINVTQLTLTNSVIIGIVIGVFSVLGALSIQHAFNIGPGSLIGAISGLNMVLVVIISLFIFGDQLSLVRGVGVLGAFGSILLIKLG